MKKKYMQEDSSVQGSVFLRLLKYAAPYWWQMALCLLFVLGITVLEIIRPKLTGEAIDLFAQSADFSQIADIAVKYGIVLMLLFVFNFLNTWILQLTGQTIIYNIRQELFEHILHLLLHLLFQILDLVMALLMLKLIFFLFYLIHLKALLKLLFFLLLKVLDLLMLQVLIFHLFRMVL